MKLVVNAHKDTAYGSGGLPEPKSCQTMSIYGALDRIVRVTSHSSLGTTGTHKFL